MCYPGTIVVEFLDPLPPGLPRDEFLKRMPDAIETATNRLLQDTREEQARLFGVVAPAPSRG
jgi:1-acyl-sn-glycerol-3-phosphate acyltransferase